MKKIKLISTTLLASTLVLAGCGHEHTFEDKWSHDETNHWHAATCEHTDEKGSLGAHKDDDNNHKCDVCEYVMSECVDSDGDHKCDICGEDLPYVSSVSISGAPETLMRGFSVTLKANVQTHNGASNKVTWSVDKSSLASISSSGKLTAKANGVVTVTATSVADKTKKASVSIEIVDPEWSEEDKDMMAYYFGEVVPFFSGNFEWTDAYYEEYECLTAESDKESDLALAIADLVAAGAEGEYDDEEEIGTYYLDCEDSNYYFEFDIYVDNYGTPCVDVYQYPQEYESWPTELIASQIAGLGVEGVTLPGITFEEGIVTSELLYDEEYDMSFINTVVISFGDASAEAYADILEGAGFVVEYDEDNGYYSAHDAAKKATVAFWEEESEYYEGVIELTIQTTEYIPDVYFELNYSDTIIAVGNTISLEIINEDGEDMPTDPEYEFWSYVDGVVSIDEEGNVTALKAGSTVIIADLIGENDKVLGEAYFYLYVENTVPTEWDEAALKAFHDMDGVDGLELPFSPFLDGVEALDPEEDGVRGVAAMSSYYSDTILFEYISAMEDDDWVCEADSTYVLFYGLYYFTCTKSVEIDGTIYNISAEVFCLDEDNYLSNSGYLCVMLYDSNFYSWEDALAPLKAWAEESEFTSFDGTLPEVASNSYSSYYDEDNGWYEIMLDTAADADAYRPLLASAGYTLEDEYNYYYVDESNEVAIEVYEMLDGSFGIYIYDTRDVLETLELSDFYYDGDNLTEEGLEFESGVTVEFAMGKGKNPGVYKENDGAGRVYWGNTITVTANPGQMLTEIDLEFTASDGNTVSCNVGEIEDGVWTGNAGEVIFTVSGSKGHIKLSSISIPAGGLPVPSPSPVCDEFPADQIAEFLGDKITDVVLAADGERFSFSGGAEYGYAAVGVYGSFSTYYSALISAGYHVDTSFYMMALEMIGYGMATVYSPNGQIEMEIIDYGDCFYMYVYPAEVEEFPAEDVAEALDKIVEGTESVVPAFFSTAYEVSEQDGFFAILGDCFDYAADFYADALDAAGWLVSSDGEGGYIALSADRDVEMSFGLFEDMEGSYYFGAFVYAAEEMLAEFPTEDVTAAIHAIDDDAEVIPAVEGADVLGYYFYEADELSDAEIRVAVTKGEAASIGDSYVGTLMGLGYEVLGYTADGVIVAKAGETVAYELRVINSWTLSLTIVEYTAE